MGNVQCKGVRWKVLQAEDVWCIKNVVQAHRCRLSRTQADIWCISTKCNNSRCYWAFWSLTYGRDNATCYKLESRQSLQQMYCKMFLSKVTVCTKSCMKYSTDIPFPPWNHDAVIATISLNSTNPYEICTALDLFWPITTTFLQFSPVTIVTPAAAGWTVTFCEQHERWKRQKTIKFANKYFTSARLRVTWARQQMLPTNVKTKYWI